MAVGKSANFWEDMCDGSVRTNDYASLRSLHTFHTSAHTLAGMPGNLEFSIDVFYIGNVMPSLLDDLNKERVKFNIEIIKLLTLLFITTGGGSLALVAEGLDNLREWILVLWGVLFAVACGIMGIIIYKKHIEETKMNEILSIIAITAIFLAGIIPVLMGIIYYTRENRRLDREEKKAASQ